MAVDQELAGPRTYGNWIRPRSPGLAGLGTLGTVILFVGAIVAIFCFMAGQFTAGLIVLAATAVLVGLGAWRDKHGMSVLERTAERTAWWRRRGAKHSAYRSGVVSRHPWGTCQLPGILAKTNLVETGDATKARFAIIEAPAQATYTVVLGCAPDGTQLVDSQDVDRMVAAWGQFLAVLTGEPGIAAVSVTVESVPDTGLKLRARIENEIAPGAAPFAADVMRQVAATRPLGASRLQAFVAITWNAATRKGGRKRAAAEMAKELASRVPALVTSLETTGAGVVHCCTAQELCEMVRVAYDPAVGTLMEEAAMTGQTPIIRWSDAGPVAATERWDSYQHDSGISTTWMMTGAPRGLVQSGVLAALLAPHPAIWRKRVTLLYRPIDPALAAVLVEADRRDAEFAATATVRPSARDLTRVTAARATATEEAGGAGLVNFGLLATATWRPGDEPRDVVAAMDTLSAMSRIQLRPCYGMQQTAFAVGLPLGMQLEKFLSVSAEIGVRL